MLEARGVSVVRGDRRLLDDVSIALVPGRVTAIVGPNGSGKSTLLKVLAGEMQPSIGDALLDGRRLKSFAPADLARRRAMVPQATTLSFPFLVIEVIRLGCSVPGFDRIPARARAIAEEALLAVDLGDFRDRLYAELSGGEKQRVHIARALCQLTTAPRLPQESAVLLLDEPTSSLDLLHQALVLDQARLQAEAGRIVVVVVHDLNLAAAWADELIVLSRGRVLARGSPVEVFTDDLLSAAFGCAIRTSCTPPPGTPYMLPHLLRPLDSKRPGNQQPPARD
jgi:iron complex transport system ATP-binding protein